MLKIFNSYTRLQEKIVVNKDNIINMYVCGVTVYDFCHIGHGRTFIFFDVVARYLRYKGYVLKYVRNITDIDDKIIDTSLKNNETCLSLSNRMIKNMHKDFSALNILPPDSEPRVTEYIDKIVEIISILLKKKYAYIACNKDVMFSVNNYLDYGLLSKQFLKMLELGTRMTHTVIKRHSSDFVLWKVSQENNCTGWDSPWGKGRPGWHIECSAISMFEFQDRIDIHGGGIDLLFPHHENELAQSVCANKNFSIKHWIHTGMVVVNNKKMSKSLGNVLLLKDLLANFDSESIRFFILSTYYRHPLYFSYKNLQNSKMLLKKIYLSLRGTNYLNNIDFTDDGKNFEIDFYKVMNNDFNTPCALSILLKLSREINKFKFSNNNKANRLAFILRKLGNILGLLLQDPECFLKNSNRYYNSDMISKINALIHDRNQARNIKDWDKADQIRQELLDLGVILEDTNFNTFWRTLS